MILVTGATGNIGKKLTRQFLKAGIKFRAVSRHEEKLAELKNQGADTMVGDLLDPGFCRKAFEGCVRAFLLVQGSPSSGKHTEEEIKVGHNYAEILKAGGIEHAVFISSIGAGEGTGSPIIDVKKQIEADLQNTGVPVTVIRPGNYMENMYNFLETISSAGFFTYPMPGIVKIPHISVEDIAYVTLKVFERGPEGWEITYMPGTEYSFFDIATAISEKLNRMIKYLRVSDDQFREVFTGFGVSGKFCDDYLAMFRYFEKGEFIYDKASVPKKFNYSPKKLDAFISELVKLIN